MSQKSRVLNTIYKYIRNQNYDYICGRCEPIQSNNSSILYVSCGTAHDLELSNTPDYFVKPAMLTLERRIQEEREAGANYDYYLALDFLEDCRSYYIYLIPRFLIDKVPANA